MPTFTYQPIERKYDGKYAELFAAVNQLLDKPDQALVISGIGDKAEVLRWQIALSMIRPGYKTGGVTYPVIEDYTVNSTLEKNGRGWMLKVWLTDLVDSVPAGKNGAYPLTGRPVMVVEDDILY